MPTPKNLTALLGAATFAAISAMAQDLTPADDLVNVLDVYYSEDWLSWAEKMPMDASLSLPESVRIISSEPYALPSSIQAPRTRAHLAQVLDPSQSGVTVSYSSQGAAALRAVTGKRIVGFQMVQATVCSGHDAKVPVGLIIQQAGSLGIQTIDNQAGLAIVNKTVSMDWRSLAKIGLVAGLSVGTALTVGGVIHTSIGITRGLTFGHLFIDQILPPLFAVGAPQPDPFVNAAKEPDSTLELAAGSCKRVMFGAVYPKSVVTGPIPLMP